jgi:DNA-binding transcriptional MerR regulator
MLKIGDFSKLSRVTVKALRHYDEIGLLCPDYVNPENGYRYYSHGKLAAVSRIQELKKTGLHLEEIRLLVNGGLNGQEIINLLKKRRESLVKVILNEKEKLFKIDRFIHRVIKENIMEKVIIKELPEVIVASMRTQIPSYQSLFQVVPEMGKKMEKHGAVCRKPEYCFNIYHDGECRDRDIDVEICEAVEAYCENMDGVAYKKIDGVPAAATLLHRGDYDSLGTSYAQLLDWMELNGYKQSDNPRECYIDGIWNCETSDDWLTEIQIPVVPC